MRQLGEQLIRQVVLTRGREVRDLLLRGAGMLSPES